RPINHPPNSLLLELRRILLTAHDHPFNQAPYPPCPETSEHPSGPDDAALARRELVRLTRVLVDSQPVAMLATTADPKRLAEVCELHVSLFLEGREQAMAAQRLYRLRDEHDHLTRRMRSFEEALRRRLTDRPREELLIARARLTDGGELRKDAAEHVARATELLREMVRRLRVPGDGGDASDSLTTILERVARRARVRIALDADDIEDERAGVLIERVAEEVMLDAPARSELTVRVRAGRQLATMSMLLERLPSPVAIALLEELALASRSRVSFQPSSHGVRLVLETPCVS
ncbi:MAG: hypothetical protein ACKVWR_15060, partial [Acidimicrobiales bacterium]